MLHFFSFRSEIKGTELIVVDPFNPKQTMRRVQERPPKSEEKVNTPTDFDEVEEFEVKEFYKL